MDLPEYYLSRAESEILQKHAADIARFVAGQRVVLADLGAGDGVKSRLLLNALAQTTIDLRYAAVDISSGALGDLERSHRAQLPRIPIECLAGDYAAGLAEVGVRHPAHVRLALFLGSNIGNHVDDEARLLLSTWRGALSNGDYLLVGFDLLKDPERLQKAYDDSQGVTREFNLNLLRRMNRELGADFEIGAFRHFARFNPTNSCMESYLVSTRDQLVRVAGECIAFSAWEAIHTEISCKYRESDIAAFARASGFTVAASYCDSGRQFMDALFRADGKTAG
jgi:L-histidine Nalpha-methyltransferase